MKKITRSLPIILMRDKTAALTHEEALYVAAIHMARVHENYENMGELWAEAYAAWDQGQIRKVVRRSQPGKFEELAQDDDSFVTIVNLPGDRVAKLLSIAPHDIELRDERVKSMQVTGLELPQGEGVFSEDSNLFIAVNGALNASTGKLIAQVSHAMQLALKSDSRDEVLEELARGVNVVSSFDDLPEEFEIVAKVHDAGFTEIPPGSLTAIAALKI